MKNFDEAFKLTIGLEGGYSNDPDDPGGETRYGVTKRDFPQEDIKNLTLERAKEIYKQFYWDKMGLDLIEDVDIACEIFDTGLNGGIRTAVKIAQRTVNALGYNISVDGYMGEVTAAALNTLTKKDKNAVYVTLNCLQGARYVELTERKPQFKKFFRGWVNHRVQLDRRNNPYV